MADLNELYRQLAFYQAGGGREAEPTQVELLAKLLGSAVSPLAQKAIGDRKIIDDPLKKAEMEGKQIAVKEMLVESKRKEYESERGRIPARSFEEPQKTIYSRINPQTGTLEMGNTSEELKPTIEEAQKIALTKRLQSQAGVEQWFTRKQAEDALKVKGNLPPKTRVLPEARAGGVGAQGEGSTLPITAEGSREIARKMANYEIAFPVGFALKSPYWQGIAEEATKINPAFDAAQYGVRYALRKDFSSGKASQNIRSLNTAVGHLADLAKAGEGLKNSDISLWNKISNFSLSQTGDPRVVKFMTAANAVAGELAQVFKGMGGTDQEIQSWKNEISSSNSPAQIQAGINMAISLLGSRLGALRSQYEGGLGKPKDVPFLNAKSRSILSGLGADLAVLDPVAGKEPPAKQNDNLDANLGADEYLKKIGLK